MISIYRAFRCLTASNIPLGARYYASSDGYRLIYSFPYARVGSLVNKVKIKQSILSGIVVPLSAALEYQEFAPSNTTAVCLVICIASNAAFFCFGQLFSKLIGKLYYNENTKQVKIAYVGFTGKRMETEVHLNDITPPGDESPGLFYSKLLVEDDEEQIVFKFQEKYYDFCDIDLARKVLGDGFGRI